MIYVCQSKNDWLSLRLQLFQMVITNRTAKREIKEHPIIDLQFTAQKMKKKNIGRT